MLFLFKTLVGWRKFILMWGLAGALIMVVVSLMLPKWYTASTTIFPPEVSPASTMYAQVLQSVSAPLLGTLGSGTAPETVYIDMLKSRAIREKVIKEFDLMDVYHASVIEQALDTFHNHCGFTLLVNGLIVVTFEDRDPERAAAIANRMIDLLDEFSRSMKTTRAGRTREFIEGQLAQHEKELAAAETKLRDFQTANDALELDEQLQAVMDIISTLTARAISLETEMEIMSHYASSSSEEYKRKQREYDEVLAQLKKLKRSSSVSDKDLVRSFLPTLGDVPELALEMIRLKRDVEIQSTVYSMLVKEYEKARIEEARDTPTVQILDRAEVPNLRSRPKRKILVIVGGVVGAGWAGVIALFTTAWRENRERAAAWRDVFRPVVGDVSRLFRRRKRDS